MATTKRRKPKAQNGASENGIVWEAPTARQLPTRIDWEPKLAELRDNPNPETEGWGVINTADTASRVSSQAVTLRKRYPEYEFASRFDAEAGVGKLFGRYVG